MSTNHKQEQREGQSLDFFRRHGFDKSEQHQQVASQTARCEHHNWSGLIINSLHQSNIFPTMDVHVLQELVHRRRVHPPSVNLHIAFNLDKFSQVHFTSSC